MSSLNSNTRDAMEAMQSKPISSFTEHWSFQMTTGHDPSNSSPDLIGLLFPGLDKETLSICVNLIENGINPNTLAHGILDIQRDASRLAAQTAALSNNKTV